MFQSERLKEKNHLEDIDINAKVILQLILNKSNVRMWPGFN